MGYIDSDTGQAPQCDRFALLARIAEQALRINEKLLAERRPRKRRAA